jgi:hypothetical protein
MTGTPSIVASTPQGYRRLQWELTESAFYARMVHGTLVVNIEPAEHGFAVRIRVLHGKDVDRA